jgi:Predicted membrane protein
MRFVFKKDIVNFLKGTSIGIVNVLPVSGGTMVLITGIFERFINAIKSLNIKALKLLFSGKFSEFAKHTDFRFFMSVLLGIAFGMFATSVFLKVILFKYEVYTWSFFIGLIIASVIYILRNIGKINLKIIFWFLIGAGLSFILSLGNKSQSNENFLYLILCGIVGSTGMIVPGISGSHLMILMGNYELIVTQAIPDLMRLSTFIDGLRILLPFTIGAIVSLISISYLLSWLMKHYRVMTLSLLSGFMLGSLPVLYPWKEKTGDLLDFTFYVPSMDKELIISIIVALIGSMTLLLLDRISHKQGNE